MLVQLLVDQYKVSKPGIINRFEEVMLPFVEES